MNDEILIKKSRPPYLLGPLCLIHLVIIIILFANTVAAQKTVLPLRIAGNWLQPQTNKWLVSFTPKFAVYKSEYWNYKSITQVNGIYNIVVTANKQQKIFKVKVNDTATLQFAEQNKAFQPLSKKYNETPNFNHYDTVGFKRSFIVNDSFTLKGWITDYDATKSDKIVSVMYTIISETHSKNVVAELDSLGRFAVTFQLLQPTSLFVKIPTSEKPLSIVAVPGQAMMMAILPPIVNLSILSGITNQEQIDERKDEFIKVIAARDQLLFMGATAMLNAEYNLYLPNEIRNSMSWNDRNDTALSFSIYNKKVLDSALQYRKTLTAFSEKYKSSKKFVQLTGQEIQYEAISKMLQHRFSNGDRNIPGKSKDYLTFIRQYNFLEPIGTTSSYYSYILEDFFDLFYMNFLEKHNLEFSITYTTDSLYREMKLSAEPLTQKEISFFEKKVTKNYVDSSEIQKATDSIKTFEESFLKHHDTFIKNWIDNSVNKAIIIAKRKYLSALVTEYGSNLFTDAILLRFALKDIENTQLQTDSLKYFYDTNVKNTLMNEEWRKCYNNLANKMKAPLSAESHFVITEKGKLVLEKLLSAYKGKVVYIDFWAPWCSPCMDQIKNYTPALEEATKGKDIVYLFLGIDCDEMNWKNAIKAYGIKGEHYLLSGDEGRILRNQFQIDGIPHYILIDKNGNVAKADAPRPEGKEQVLNAMEKLLAQ